MKFQIHISNDVCPPDSKTRKRGSSAATPACCSYWDGAPLIRSAVEFDDLLKSSSAVNWSRKHEQRSSGGSRDYAEWSNDHLPSANPFCSAPS